MFCDARFDKMALYIAVASMIASAKLCKDGRLCTDAGFFGTQEVPPFM
jgi:hypothetical protein